MYIKKLTRKNSYLRKKLVFRHKNGTTLIIFYTKSIEDHIIL